ncbi:MAG: FAD:protein FMN transferase [Bdellovibrionales bacterium]|nr:FAD:protein FMN transferase [Bdellovibrionales bacterium]
MIGYTIAGAFARSVSVVILPLAISGSWAAAGASEFERTNFVMGTPLKIQVSGVSKTEAVQISEKILASVRKTERRLSTWVADSELSLLNASEPGKLSRLSADLSRDLENAFSCESWTNRAFSPKLGPLVQLWELRKKGRWIDLKQLARTDPSQVLSWASESSELISKQGALFWKKNHPLASLEEGAFGKGVALDDASIGLIDSAAEVNLSLGGQLKRFGKVRQKKRWVPVADFRNRDRPLVEVLTAASDVSTSSQTEKSFEDGGKIFGHILDPRTGAPSAAQGSMTVFTGQGWLADCLSTGFFVLDPAEAVMLWKQARLQNKAWARDVEWLWIGPDVGMKPAGGPSRGVAAGRGVAEDAIAAAGGSTPDVLTRKPGIRARASCGLKDRIRFLGPKFPIQWQGC